jgi:predicted alpha/beta-hydrolase family hydrolase
MILAHIAGIPVEETLLSFAPIGMAGVGWAAWHVAHVLRRRRRADAAPARDVERVFVGHCGSENF